MIAIDTNTIVYAYDARDERKRDICASLIDRLAEREDVRLPLQVAGELSNVLRRRLGMAPQDIFDLVRIHLEHIPSFPYSAVDIVASNALVVDGVCAFWDGVLLASCERQGCTWLISEDMQPGFRMGGLEIVSPFDTDGGPNTRLMDVLAE